MSLIYLDWNVFNRLEKLPELPPGEKPVYEFISRLSNHLCLVQYWNEKAAKWHYRPFSFPACP